MDQKEEPMLEAPAEYQRLERYGFNPPAHHQDCGVDPSVLEVPGERVNKAGVDYLRRGGSRDVPARSRRPVIEDHLWVVREEAHRLQ